MTQRNQSIRASFLCAWSRMVLAYQVDQPEGHAHEHLSTRNARPRAPLTSTADKGACPQVESLNMEDMT